MGKLSIYLPPFAGDYAGACSALFDFSCLIVLCDAACCTKNYIDYDEPRWSRDKTTTLCAQLRTLEVTLGDDRRILRQAAEAAQAQRPDFVARRGGVSHIRGCPSTRIPPTRKRPGERRPKGRTPGFWSQRAESRPCGRKHRQPPPTRRARTGSHPPGRHGYGKRYGGRGPRPAHPPWRHSGLFQDSVT